MDRGAGWAAIRGVAQRRTRLKRLSSSSSNGLSCSAACGSSSHQGSNSRLLHWQGDSFPVSHQGSPPPPDKSFLSKLTWASNPIQERAGRPRGWVGCPALPLVRSSPLWPLWDLSSGPGGSQLDARSQLDPEDRHQASARLALWDEAESQAMGSPRRTAPNLRICAQRWPQLTLQPLSRFSDMYFFLSA